MREWRKISIALWKTLLHNKRKHIWQPVSSCKPVLSFSFLSQYYVYSFSYQAHSLMSHEQLLWNRKNWSYHATDSLRSSLASTQVPEKQSTRLLIWIVSPKADISTNQLPYTLLSNFTLFWYTALPSSYIIVSSEGQSHNLCAPVALKLKHVNIMHCKFCLGVVETIRISQNK